MCGGRRGFVIRHPELAAREDLFFAVVERYSATHGSFVAEVVAEEPSGNQHAADRLATLRNQNLAALEQAFQRDVGSGDAAAVPLFNC